MQNLPVLFSFLSYLFSFSRHPRGLSFVFGFRSADARKRTLPTYTKLLSSPSWVVDRFRLQKCRCLEADTVHLRLITFATLVGCRSFSASEVPMLGSGHCPLTPNYFRHPRGLSFVFGFRNADARKRTLSAPLSRPLFSRLMERAEAELGDKVREGGKNNIREKFGHERLREECRDRDPAERGECDDRREHASQE